MKLYKIALMCALVLSGVFSSYADCGALPPCVGDPGEIPGDSTAPANANCCNTAVTVPFDGGISLLLAAGLGIGVISAYKRKKQAVSL